MSRLSSIHLMDDDYEELLDKCDDAVRTIDDFRVLDCTDGCNKSTTSEIGLCNDKFTTQETALFPKQFKTRKSMKYRRYHHVCPFDDRLLRIERGHDPKNMIQGCFYSCSLRKGTQGREQLLRRVKLARVLHVTGYTRSIIKKFNR
jgi:hypothetical protein